MDETHAQPGDTIEITWDHDNWLGKRFVVINPPEGNLAPLGAAWFDVENGHLSYYFLSCNYKIISRSRKTPNRDVDTFLKEQRDDNLSSVFR